MLRPAHCAQVQLNNAQVQLLKQAMECQMVNGLVYLHSAQRLQASFTQSHTQAFFLSLSTLSINRRHTHTPMYALGELGVQCLV